MIDKRKLELFRLSPIGRVFIKTVEIGAGQLRSGSYQFAVRFANSQNGESTKFSIFTNPISIADLSSSGTVSGPIGQKTGKAIVLGVEASAQEVIQYDVYQIAVIENNTGNPFSPTNVSLSQFYNLDSQGFDFYYDSNDKFNSIDLAEVSIDDAAIETFKTLTVKNNRLVGGNITYKKLKYDRGKPEVSFGSIIETNIPIRQGYDKSSSETRGYFGDEVYRFAVTYWDEYGNFSVPSALDMSNVSGNAASNSGFKDMKFPPRSSDGGQIIRTIDGITYAVARGLKLFIRNHPTWAKGMVILRAERKKDILFQSPLIPTSVVQSPNAVNNYPGDGRKLPSTFGTITPKNMFKPNNQGIVRVDSGASVDYSENYSNFEYCKKIHIAFPPETIFNNSELPYSTEFPKGGVKMESIDYVSLRPIDYSNMNKEISDADLGNKIDTSVHVTFAALNDQDYASSNKSKAQISNELSQSRNVVDEAVSFDVIAQDQDRFVITSINESAPTSFFGAYADLKIDPDGLYNGYEPSNQKCAIVVSKGDRPDPSHSALSDSVFGFPISSLETQAGKIDIGGLSVNSSKNRNLLNPSGLNNTLAPRHYLEIVNFKKGLSDTRYGDPNAVQSFIPTGSIYNNKGMDMSSSDIEIDVYGGDCYISPFTFKVHDSVYGIVNVEGGATYNKDDWGGTDFTVSEGGAAVRRPVPYRSASSCVGLYLESEVNGYLEDKILYSNTNKNSSITKAHLDWSNSSVVSNEVVKYLDKYYMTIRPVASDEFPGKSIGLSNMDVSNIGYAYIDLGKVYEGKIFQPIEDKDLFLTTNSYRESKVPFQYIYNPNYSFENRSKFFLTTGAGEEQNRIKFESRLIYSDLKILQTNIEGFSRFRLLNFYDIEESKGAVTKLINFRGRLMSVQERALAYLPFEANIIEAQDGVQLAIRSADIVGIPQYIEDYGSKYIRSVISTPYALFFADTNNSSIIAFSEGIRRINDMDIDMLIRDYSAELINKDVNDNDVNFYADLRSTRLVMNYTGKGIIMDQDDNVIHSVIRFENDDQIKWRTGLFANSRHYVFGFSSSFISEGVTDGRYVMADFDSRDRNSPSPFGDAIGEYKSKIISIVNQDVIFPKVIDVIRVNSTGPNKIKVRSYAQGVLRESFGENVSASTIPDRGEAWFLLNAIREDIPEDAPERYNPKRLRGEHFEVEFEMDKELMYSFISKYRISDRRI